MNFQAGAKYYLYVFHGYDRPKTMRYNIGLPSPTHGVTSLLIALISVYLLCVFGAETSVGIKAYTSLVLNPSEVIYSFHYWRLLSYALVHDISSPMHLIFNALMLYMFGTPLEERWGERRFFIFVSICVLLGGIFVLIAYLLALQSAVVVGFSAATMGLTIAWGLTFSKSTILLFGLLPLNGHQLVGLSVMLELIYALSANSISSAAHFGGIAAAFIFCFGLYKLKRWQR
jgi:membrane associated rhomboid family serine protease